MRELKQQFASALLVVLAAAAVVCAVINFQQNFQPGKRFRLADDGITWVDRSVQGKNQVIARHIEKNREATSGLRTGDRLHSINGVKIERAIDAAKVLIALGPWAKATYVIDRRGREVTMPLIIGERVPDVSVSYQYAVGTAYLLIGLFVYFRRGNAPKSLHFLVLCLVSFVLSSFHYTGKLNRFDQVIYWGNICAGLLAPTIFFHFCLTFPESRGLLRKRWAVALLYLPALLLGLITLAIAMGNLRINASAVEVRWTLDRIHMAFLALLYLLGGAVLAGKRYRAEDPMVRQQLKWLRNGALAGILPFVVLYVVPYISGSVPGDQMKLSILFLGIVPLTWAYAIIRYRLMDVDVIFQQGYVYTLATLAVLGVFYSLFVLLGRVDDLSPSAIVALIFVATFVFQPIRNWLQEVLDRYWFYKGRYEHRRTLIEFARELGAETHLDHMLRAVSDRLTQTLSIHHVGFFVAEDRGFELSFASEKLQRHLGRTPLDLSFLQENPSSRFLFFERTRFALDVVSAEMSPSVRQTIATLDLTYYVPCTVRGKTIAYMGLSRTDKGDFLTSDDLELMVTLAGYFGMAIENTRLYRSLQLKVAEYERLKEFSENIVESINVGVLAVDHDDRVESWNNEMERLTGLSREQAVRRRLEDLFPADLCQEFARVRGETGIHHIYKFAFRPNQAPLSEVATAASNGNGNHNTSPTPAPREYTLNLAIAPLVTKEQEQIGRLIMFDDITDRSELERRLVQADKLSSIGLLAAGVAHEVNTPLAVISTYSQMLAKQVTGDDQKSKLLDKIAKQTFRASEIVNSLLNFSRVTPTEFAEVDLNRVIAEVVSLVGHQLQKAHVEVNLEFQEKLPCTKGNSGKLQQVFLNLILNARDAMENGGTLTLRTYARQDSVHVEISDTGQGIPPENLARIYDPFFTTKAATKKGTGLGLSVTYGILREHGATIEVQSEVGVGTLFHLEFPMVRKAVNA
ncbi:MAG TPA: ATP-binding protein [Bryobacteraceae bacterium]|nr:ATP-binding protein [Bryobacteraceae bacterium]